MGDLSSLKKIESGQEVVRPFSAYNLKKNDTVKSTDTTPFLFRPIPPLSTPYIREKLVGASMAWNQLDDISSRSNYSETVYKVEITNNETTLTVLATPSTTKYSTAHPYMEALNLVETHKYLVYISKNVYAGYTSPINVVLHISDNPSYTTITGSKIFTNTVAIRLYENITTSAQPGWSRTVKGGIIDLTLAFGTAIADRIYSLEQAQAGSGIAWIKSYGFLTDDYYAYGSGIQSVCADRKEIVGKNFVEGKIESSHYLSITSNGTILASYQDTVYMYYAKVLKGQTYTATTGSILVCGFFYDKPIEGSASYNNERTVSNNTTFVAPISGYVAFRVEATYETPHLEIGSTATTYEPYHKTTISLGHDELRGVMQLDANNNLVYYGDEKTSDGVIDRKFGIVDLGSLTWTKSSGITIANAFYATLPTVKTNTNGTLNAICSKYKTELFTRSDSVIEKTIIVGSSAFSLSPNVLIIDSSYNDATAFTTAMSGVYLVYPLETETTEQSTPFTSPQYLFDGGTEEFIDYGVEQSTRDVAVPVGHVTEYMGASDGTEIKDKFYLPTLPNSDGIYDLNCLIQNGAVREFSWRLSNEGYSPSYRGKNVVHMGDSWVELYNIAELASEFVGYRVTNVGFQASAITNVYDGTPVTDADKFSLIKLAHALETNVWTEQNAAAVGKSWAGQLAKLKAIDWSLVDVLILSYGVNDFNYQSAIGDAEARDEESVGGALKTAIGILENLNPYMEIVVTTPCFRFMSPDSDNMTNFGTRILLEEYRNVIGLTAKECGIKVVDMGAISGINDANRGLTLLSDGLHPTQLGQIMWADAFSKSLECGYTGAFDINVFNVLKDGDNLCFDSEQYTKHKKWNSSYTSNLTKYLCTRATQQYKNAILGQAFYASLPTGSVLRMTGIGKKIGTQNHRVDIYVYNSDKSDKLLEKTSSAIKYTSDTAFDHSWTTEEDYTNCWVIFAVKQMCAWADGKGLVRDVKCTVMLPS